ncbi:MAG TPA: LysR substrate-binding domain-containing protein [Burkholderiaceae bacterium]|nr:LysR substrate-binding domain-containing protein [Burkholderiaceae bacterium]
MRPLDLELLRSFVAVADRETFARAAEQVHRTQSAVTQQMARLEEQLGVSLFRKVGRSKRLTEHGVRLLEYARRLLALNDEAIESLAAPDLRGPLRIGSIYDATEFLLPPLLARFSQLYPNLQIEVHTDRTAHLMQDLKRGEIEIALVGRPQGDPDPAHPSVRLRTSPLVWIAGTDYVHQRSQPVPLVLPDEPSSYRATALAALNAHDISWRIRHVSTSLAFSTLRAALRAGLGVTVRVIEMLTPELRVLTEAEGLPRLPNMCLDLYLRDENVSAPAIRLFESMGEVSVRRPVQARTARAKQRRKAA